MKLLLDTDVFLWLRNDSNKVSPQALTACRNRDNILYLSIASNKLSINWANCNYSNIPVGLYVYFWSAIRIIAPLLRNAGGNNSYCTPEEIVQV